MEVYNDNIYCLYPPAPLPHRIKNKYKKRLAQTINKDNLNTLPHILIGVNELQVHPIQIDINQSLARQFHKHRMYRSQLSGKLLCSGSLGGHTPVRVAGMSDIIQSLITGHLDHINLKDILKQSNSRNILKKPSDFLLPI